MVNNSDGLSPSLRPQLGVGFNRALPAPFGFDNGLHCDGINDYLLIPFIGLPLNDGCIEFWIKSNAAGGLFSWVATDGSTYGLRASNGTSMYLSRNGSAAGGNISLASGLNHVVINWGSSGMKIIVNNFVYVSDIVASTFYSWFVSKTFLRFSLGVEFFNATSFIANALKIDEFRIYNRQLLNAEISLNYNSSFCNNPCNTENLITWYKFQEFENLDFSALQDNSDIRLGIRDLSGKNNHAQPINMDTNPSSPNYVLKPF